MSIKTIYTCDKCGGEQFSSQQFWTVGVWATCSVVISPTTTGEKIEDKRIQVCRPCLESFGIHVKVTAGENISPPTTEELIREIIERAQQ